MKHDLVAYLIKNKDNWKTSDIDIIFNTVNDLLCSGEFETVDSILKEVAAECEKVNSQALLSFLTITCMADHVLKNRGAFYWVTEGVFKSEYPDSFSLILHGLEPK